MSPADRIAYSIKCQPLLKQASAVLLGYDEMKILSENSQPCDPPDLSADKKTFCGIPCIFSHEQSRLALVIDIPILKRVTIGVKE
jgi:hypothetical protein